LHGFEASGDDFVTIKTALIALIAAAALIGAAIVSVPSTTLKTSEAVHFGVRTK
jgi:hypothetical protein